MKTLKEAALEIPGILNTGLLQLKDRGMKLPMCWVPEGQEDLLRLNYVQTGC